MVYCQDGWKFTFWAKDVINTQLLVFFGFHGGSIAIIHSDMHRQVGGNFPHKRWGDDLAETDIVSGWFDPADFPLLLSELPQTFGCQETIFKEDTEKAFRVVCLAVCRPWAFDIVIFGSLK